MELADCDSFYHVLNYIYTGKLILYNLKIGRIFDFIAISKTLELTSLSEELSLMLAKSLNLENALQIYEKAYRYDQKQLRKSCEIFMDKNAEILVSQESLLKLSSDSLKMLISRESFELNERRIVDIVNEWHVYQNRTSNDLNKELVHFKTNIKIASGSGDNSVKIWNAESGQCVRTLKGHSSSVTSMQFLSNNNTLATGSRDTSIKLWKVESGECIRTLTGHSSAVTSLQLLANSNDNNNLASGSLDASIKIWNVDSGECIHTGKRIVGQVN